MDSTLRCCAFFFFIFLTGAASFQWSPTPRDGEVVYSCADHDLKLTWDYTLDAGEAVTLIEWNYAGLSQELVALTAHGAFLPTASFAHRVQLVSKAGLLIRHVTTGDSGNYSVTVTGTDSSGATFTTTRTVLVQVAESLQTTDHELHGRLEPVAVYSNASDQFHAVLACGQFIFAGNPPVALEWLTPDGLTVPSTGYQDGYFKLYLSNPVGEGSYTCRLAPASVNASCSGGHSPQASVQVSAVLARLSIVEAESSRKDEELQSLRDDLTMKDTDLQSLRDDLTRKNTDLQSLRDDLTRKDTEMQSLRDDFANVSTLCQASLTGPCHPDRHTVINDTWRLSSVGIGGQCDDHLQPGWYRFVVNGLNAVIPTSCVQMYHCQTRVSGWLDLQGQSLPAVNQELSARVCFSYGGCCSWETPTVVHNCGFFYVYELQPPPRCTLAHCVELQQ